MNNDDAKIEIHLHVEDKAALVSCARAAGLSTEAFARLALFQAILGCRPQWAPAESSQNLTHEPGAPKTPQTMRRTGCKANSRNGTGCLDAVDGLACQHGWCRRA